jgi:hypothetical protein
MFFLLRQIASQAQEENGRNAIKLNRYNSKSVSKKGIQFGTSTEKQII